MQRYEDRSTKNQSHATLFILLGFSSHGDLYIFLFLAFFLVYTFTLLGNLLIIVLSRMDSHLNTPMYFFLSNFSFLEICYTTVTVPKMLSDLFTGNRTISFCGCLTQMYFFFFFGTTEFFLLALMAFDRYLAICNPLRYQMIMSYKVCLLLVLCSWISGSLVPITPTSVISQLSFNSSNKVNHFFCDVAPIIKLSSDNTFVINLIVFMLSSIVVLSSILLVMVSYIFIICTILKIPSATGKQKAFSTCASHLIVVTIFYGTVIFMYVRPASSDSIDLNKVVSIFYSVITPMLNPIIYSLRNKEVKEALRKATRKLRTFENHSSVITSISSYKADLTTNKNGNEFRRSK
ncbi:olfactory receptor 2AP1-like [Microcaecilia unicolor]|uniref:Olfactory receptor n=1 Tax=Microcaecilia unicolor TaxID=1415580 RepID=A0A6P7X6J7_9AMPH|nr:olfactory receptor 2AP1-like [Microcaecilia unicolor]